MIDTQLKQLKNNVVSLSKMIQLLEQELININESTSSTIDEINHRLVSLKRNKEQMKQIETKLENLKNNQNELNYQIGLYETNKRSSGFFCFNIKSLMK